MTGDACEGAPPASAGSVPAGPWLSVAEVADLLGVNPKLVRARLADGSLRYFRLGPKIIRIRLADVEKWLDTCTRNSEQ